LLLACAIQRYSVLSSHSLSIAFLDGTMSLAIQRCHPDRLTLFSRKQQITNRRLSRPSTIGQRRGSRALARAASAEGDVLRVHYVRKDLAYKVG
jgi:hypothetical protein